MEAKKAILIFVLISCGVVASAYADPNCKYCECTPKYIGVTFNNIKLYSGRCETEGCGKCDIVTTDDPKNPINRTYILEQDKDNPCRWFYIDFCGPVSSVVHEDNETYIATGLEIEVIKGDYGPNSVSVSLNSKLECWLCGLASYFWAVADVNDGCVKVTNVPNIGTGTGILDCCCSLWPAGEWPSCAPPWYPGLGGTVAIRELGTNLSFGDFNGDGIVNFEDYAFLVTEPVSYQVLRRFAENWLLETIPECG